MKSVALTFTTTATTAPTAPTLFGQQLLGISLGSYLQKLKGYQPLPDYFTTPTDQTDHDLDHLVPHLPL